MRVVMMAVLAASLVAAGCSDDPLSPRTLAGRYPLALVNGEAPGQYFPVEAINCQAAFQQGELEIKSNSDFRLELSYYYNCSVSSPSEGPGTIIVNGSGIREVSGTLYLDGCLPPTETVTCPFFSFQVTPDGGNLEVAFLSTYAIFWGDPVFTMGPKQ